MSVLPFAEFSAWSHTRAQVEAKLVALDVLSCDLTDLFKTAAGAQAIRTNYRQLIETMIRLQDLALDIRPPKGGHHVQPEHSEG